MATKSIGTGGDYTSYASYLVYLQTLGTLSAPEIGQQKNQEITHSSQVDFTGFTPTSTNRWTLETEAGASFRDHANKATNGLRYNASNGAAVRMTGNYSAPFKFSVVECTVRNLQLSGNSGGGGGGAIESSYTGGDCNRLFEFLILRAPSDYSPACIILGGIQDKIRNSICIVDYNGTGTVPIQTTGGASADFCTFVRPSNHSAQGNMLGANYNTSEFNNCVWMGFANTRAGGGTISGSNNATDQASFPTGLSGQTSLTATTEFEEPSNASSVMDFRLKSTSVKCKDNGSTDSTNGANDIIGTARPSGSAYDIGCWELVSGGGGSPAFANPFGLLGVGRAA